MGFLSRIFGGKERQQGSNDAQGIHIYVRCDRCGEAIHVRVNKQTDVSREYDQSDQGSLALHKEILGSRCQNLMYVHLSLDSAYRVVSSSTERCTIITESEYDAARQQAGA